ncbi:MAG: hypothetical protein ACO1RT_14580 [Planctomycetaceae bacterium]
MKPLICASLLTLCVGASTGCSNDTDTAQLPTPELTIEDYERMAAEEEAELKATIEKNAE